MEEFEYPFHEFPIWKGIQSLSNHEMDNYHYKILFIMGKECTP